MGKRAKRVLLRFSVFGISTYGVVDASGAGSWGGGSVTLDIGGQSRKESSRRLITRSPSVRLLSPSNYAPGHIDTPARLRCSPRNSLGDAG